MISFEKEFIPTPPTREEVIQIFKETGESPEAMGAYSLWFAEKQKEADESKGVYSQLELNIKVADLLVDCNLVFDADDYINGAWIMMENELARISPGGIPPELSNLLDMLRFVTEKSR